MELIIACVYCGINRLVSVTDDCYTDLMADKLMIPQSPSDVLRKHYWVEMKIHPEWDGTEE